MKYLNTKYGNLFDSNNKASTSGNYIYFDSSYSPRYVEKNIPSLSKVNISFFRDSIDTLIAGNYSRFLRVSLSNFSITEGLFLILLPLSEFFCSFKKGFD